MNFEDCIGLNADEAVSKLHRENPNLKIVVHPTMAPRYNGRICLSESMVVRQVFTDGVLELTVVMVD